MRRSFPLLVGIAGALVILDQWTKHWANTHLAYREPVHVVGDLVRLTWARNSGIAFSLLAGRGFPLYVFSIVASLAVLWLFLRHARMSAARQVSLALILGGALGNLIDRLRTGLVVDFILLAWRGHEFPVFNVADIAVTSGVALFALAWSRDEPAATAAGASPPGAVAGEAPGEGGPHEQESGTGGAAGRDGAAGGPLAREGADRPLA